VGGSVTAEWTIRGNGLHLYDENEPLPLSIYGLFRCCVATYNVDAPASHATREGDKLDCRECNGGLVVINETWQWDASRKDTP
jgi:hypothetical protein